jgi:hypothetical protein
VKPADISRKKREYMKYKIHELATNSKHINVRELCKGISGFKIATDIEVT